MHHDHDVGAAAQGGGVASLLVGPVATIARVNDGLEPEAPRQLGRAVGRAVIDENDSIDHFGDLGHRLRERRRGVERRHDEHELVPVDHAPQAITARSESGRWMRSPRPLSGEPS